MLDLLKVLVCMLFLLYSCYSDIKTRRISNKIWSVMLAVGSVFIIHDILKDGTSHIIHMFLSFIFIFVFVYLLFRLNSFGEDEAKVLMFIFLIIPTFPKINVFGYNLPLDAIPPTNLFTFSVLGNAVILTVIVPFGLFLYNLTQVPIREIFRKIWYLFLGYRYPVSRLRNGHIRLVEVYEKIGNEVVSRFTRDGTLIDEAVIQELEEYVDKGLIDEKVWVTLGLPFMIPITAGFATAVVFGDLIFYMTIKYLMI
ncbi:MAG: prepilin peptidase [Methanosarcinaceae archaeon]|nr:prepilin peptidase [Methanosarcinaceae archaeon]